MVTGVAALSKGASTHGAVPYFGAGGIAVVFGVGDGNGGALLTRTGGQFREVIRFGRRSDPGIELQDGASLERAAAMARV